MLSNYEISVLESAARTANINSADQQNLRHRGVAILVNVSAVGGTPGKIAQLDIQAKIGAGYLSIASFGLSGRSLSIANPKEIHVSNYIGSHADVTAAMLDLVSSTATICTTNAAYVYVGQLYKFGLVTIDLTATVASADGGVMVVEYWNGSTWTAVAGLVDGTAITGNTLRQDGSVTFTIPSDWAKGDGNGITSPEVPLLYFVRFRTTTSTGTDAIAQSIVPSRTISATGQYGFVLAPVPFSSGSATGWTMPAIQGVLPKRWRLTVIHEDQSNSITYDVVASYLM